MTNTPLNITAQTWLNKALLQHPKLDESLARKACQYAETLSEQCVSPYTESTLAQGLQMADLLLALNCDNATLAAAIVYPSLYYAQPNSEKAKQALDPTVIKLAQGAERMEAIHNIHKHPQDLNAQQSDQLRKMLLSIVDDVRIVLIKLAERLTTLRNLKYANTAQQHHIAKQCLTFYAALANRLGIGQLKWQLEDLSFRYLNPEAYFQISKALNMRRIERETFINTMLQDLQTLISESTVNDFSLSGRAKHIYSIYKKAERKQLPITEIYDASALRVLVPSVDDCYTILGLVHGQWPHIQKEFDDYIAHPKPNGYQSIHTAVVAGRGHNVEIQIRSYAMHEAAELGVAAHWKYKEGAGGQNTYEEKIARLRELMDWQKEITDTAETESYESIFSDRVYVFTPQGDVFDLPAGSTPLDFAYHIHSAIGHRCKGARVNEKMVPLTYALQTGERVEIITSKTEHPSRDWLNPQLGYLKTPTAKQKVRHWLKRQNYDTDLAQGQLLFDKAVKNTPFKKGDLAKLTKTLNVKKVEDVLVAIGSGHLGVASVLQQLQAQEGRTEKADIPLKIPQTKAHTPPSSPLTISGVGNLLTQPAGCCKPIPGDQIVGYITKGRGVTIHQTHCPNIQHEILTKPERIIEVDWQSAKATQQFPVDISLTAENQQGLVRDISSAITQADFNIVGLSTRLDRRENRGMIHITVELPNSAALHTLLTQLRQIPGVLDVHRI